MKTIKHYFLSYNANNDRGDTRQEDVICTTVCVRKRIKDFQGKREKVHVQRDEITQLQNMIFATKGGQNNYRRESQSTKYDSSSYREKR